MNPFAIRGVSKENMYYSLSHFLNTTQTKAALLSVSENNHQKTSSPFSTKTCASCIDSMSLSCCGVARRWTS